MNIDEIQKNINIFNETTLEILTFIGYGSAGYYEIDIDKNSSWSIYNDELVISIGDDVYSYTISSYSSKGEKLYMNSDDEYTYVMCYPEYDNWENATIIILKNLNQVDEIEY